METQTLKRETKQIISMVPTGSDWTQWRDLAETTQVELVQLDLNKKKKEE